MAPAGPAQAMPSPSARIRAADRIDRPMVSVPTMILLQRAGLASRVPILERQRVGNVVLVDVADVLHSLAADALACDSFHVVEPDIRVQAARLCLLAQLPHPSGPAVVGRKRKQPLVQS